MPTPGPPVGMTSSQGLITVRLTEVGEPTEGACALQPPLAPVVGPRMATFGAVSFSWQLTPTTWGPESGGALGGALGGVPGAAHPIFRGVLSPGLVTMT